MPLYSDDEIHREIDKTEKDAINQKQRTDLAKLVFINQIKTGLGDEIKNTPKVPKIRQKTVFEKIKNVIRGIFLKF